MNMPIKVEYIYYEYDIYKTPNGHMTYDIHHINDSWIVDRTSLPELYEYCTVMEKTSTTVVQCYIRFGDTVYSIQYAAQMHSATVLRQYFCPCLR